MCCPFLACFPFLPMDFFSDHNPLPVRCCFIDATRSLLAPTFRAVPSHEHPLRSSTKTFIPACSRGVCMEHQTKITLLFRPFIRNIEISSVCVAVGRSWNKVTGRAIGRQITRGCSLLPKPALSSLCWLMHPPMKAIAWMWFIVERVVCSTCPARTPSHIFLGDPLTARKLLLKNNQPVLQ